MSKYYCGTVVNPTVTDLGYDLTGTFVDICNSNKSVFEGGENLF